MDEQMYSFGLKQRVVVYDLECLTTFFCYCDVNRDDEKDKHTFVIHESLNQLDELVGYLRSGGIKQVGFNNLGYDAQLIHFILDNYSYLKTLSAVDICTVLSRKSTDIINTDKSDVYRTGSTWYHEWNLQIEQLDLYKIWHFDNKARATRLKDLQVAMKWHNVQDMPIHHTTPVSKEMIPDILSYCDNDIMSTLEFYKKTREKIDLRIALQKEYGLKNILNANDAKLGSEIFAKLISDDMKIPMKELKEMRTHRSSIDLNDCILDFIKFESKEFNSALDRFKAQKITQTKGSLEFSVKYDGFQYDFGLGGIHGCVEPGIYTSNVDNVIKTCDVTSLYPMIAITNGFYPQHLGKRFLDIYLNVFERRNKAKQAYKANKSDKVSKAINEGLKLALNGTYGKSNDIYSFFYDPKFTMQITINGQLMLCMLAERLSKAGFRVLMINTDGLECVVPRNMVSEYDRICKEWENETKLSLEFDEYDKMVIRDVNNYIAVYKGMSDVKYKGCFEINKEYHKDPSFPIVPIALSEYFVYGMPVSHTIENLEYYNKWESGKKTMENITVLDFCGRGKFKSDSKGELRCVVNDGYGSYRTHKEPQQKTTRYRVTNEGCAFMKIYNSGGEECINKGYLVTEHNRHEGAVLKEENCDIDYEFYVDECKKILNVIEPPVTQLKLF